MRMLSIYICPETEINQAEMLSCVYVAMFHFTGDHVLMLIIILCFRASIPNKNGIHVCPLITSYRNVLNHNQSTDA